MARRQTEFQTIRSEGGLLPADLLQRILDTKEPLPGTNPEDYGLPRGERINEVITQSWNRLRKHWLEFRAATAALPATDPATGATNDKWSLPLLRELGFGPLPRSAGPEIGGRTYAISRFVGPVPVHLVGCGVDLDRRAAGVRGAAAVNPHGLVQEFVNRSPGHLWAIVSNGLRLRILRDNHALSRQSFLELDLEAMFAGEVYSDFVLLWLSVHATRFAPRDGGGPETCWLEEWTKEADKRGARVLGDLRVGVERALQILGEGFSGHPGNTQLRGALRSGELQLADFHGQLLRVVYRLIFLFVAEDRVLDGQSLLYPRDDSSEARAARDRYATFYSTGRLRELAGKIKGSRHPDLWRQFQVVVGALSGEESTAATRSALALPALGSLLWNPSSTAALNDAQLTNYDFLEALRHLAFTRPDKVLRPVNYRNLGAEELGGVYESLLALTPQFSADGARFSFAEFAGNERKTSGSYYTPDALVQLLLDSALDPVVEEAIKGKTGPDVERAILNLKVCDPAVGSGHFLVGAAHRLARHLSRARSLQQGDSEPSPLLYQHALRDVIGRCLYGVDLSPMAAELCRVSLWLEALEPGKPLSFLDHHIRVGNSLLGATPDLVAAGIPEGAFSPLEGDDERACAVLKTRNKDERKGLGPLFAEEEAEIQAELLAAVAALQDLPDERPEDIRKKERALRQYEETQTYRRKRKLADVWCAAFFVEKRFLVNGRDSSASGITQGHLQDIAAGKEMSVGLAGEVARLTAEHRFFHWYLAFPEVIAQGGFDCILGNPPWERLKLQEQEWFAARLPEVAVASNAAKRRALIAGLKADSSPVYQEFLRDVRRAEAEPAFLRHSGRFPLCGVGRDINTAAVFLEHMRSAVSADGAVGCVAPAGSMSGDTTRHFVKDVLQTQTLKSLYHFENEDLLFEGVHHAFRFCIVTISGAARTFPRAEFVYYARSVTELKEPGRAFTMSSSEVLRLNPTTHTLPAFKYAKDAVLARAIYQRVSVLYGATDAISTWRLLTRPGHFHMSNDSELFVRGQDLEEGAASHVPLYESKMMWMFDHRFGTYEGQTGAQANQGKLPETSSDWHRNPANGVVPRYWVETSQLRKKKEGAWSRSWEVGVRDITSSSTERTAVACVLPSVAVGGTLMLLASPVATAAEHNILVSVINSFVFDYAARQKVTGMHLNPSVFRQLPVPALDVFRRPSAFDSSRSLGDWMMSRALELTYTAWDLQPFASDCGYAGPPFQWDDKRRATLRCELDAALFHLYLAADDNGDWKATEGEVDQDLVQLKSSFPRPRDAVCYIMETFPIVKRMDEQAHGDYRTSLQILAIFDQMQRAIATNTSYETPLDPQPGDPRVAHLESTRPASSGLAV